MKETWQERLRQVVVRRPQGRTFAAFNLNVDVVARVTQEAVRRLASDEHGIDWKRVAATDVESLRAVRSREDFLAVLRRGFREGKSALLVREDEALVDWWRGVFTERVESMGGQAGIIANQMAALGAASVVYSPLLSPRQASFFLDGVTWPVVEDGRVRYVPAVSAGRPADMTREPWVFEYGKGERFAFPDETFVTPRANRAIITTGVQGPERRFHADVHGGLAALGADLDVGFLAGYHQCGERPDDPQAVMAYIEQSCADLALLASRNPRLKLHVEYVPAKARELEAAIYRRLGQAIHSFGINEAEIRALLRRFGYEQIASELEERERAYLLYQGGLALLRELGVERVHVHNLGYYVVILRKPYGRSAAHVRDACVYASAVNARKAQVGGFVAAADLALVRDLPFSDVGFEQLQAFAAEIRQAPPAGVSAEAIERFPAEGILEADDHWVIVTPSHIVPNPVGTVGMGDTISSSAYFFEVCGTVAG